MPCRFMEGEFNSFFTVSHYQNSIGIIIVIILIAAAEAVGYLHENDSFFPFPSGLSL
jgi:general stress protein CsbA